MTLDQSWKCPGQAFSQHTVSGHQLSNIRPKTENILKLKLLLPLLHASVVFLRVFFFFVKKVSKYCCSGKDFLQPCMLVILVVINKHSSDGRSKTQVMGHFFY